MSHSGGGVVSQQPKAGGKGAPQNVRDWSTGICGCCQDTVSLCHAYWCFPCFLCTLSESMNECPSGPCCCGGVSGGFLGYGGCHMSGIHAPNVFLVALRTKLRTQYGIKGSVCRDVCCVWCCNFCVATQLMREIKHQSV